MYVFVSPVANESWDTMTRSTYMITLSSIVTITELRALLSIITLSARDGAHLSLQSKHI